MKHLLSTGSAPRDIVVDTCLNLRPSSDGLHLTVTDNPLQLGRFDGFSPLAVYSQEPPIVIIYKGLDVFALEVYEDNVVEVSLGQLPGAPCSHFFVEHRLIVMTEDGPWCVARDPDGRWHNFRQLYPDIPIIVRAKSADTYNATINLPDMGEPLTSTSIATAAVRQKILSPIDRAYTDIYNRAHADGVLTAPVIAYVTLTFPDGRLLFTSPPVLLTPPGDASDTVIAFDSDDRHSFSSATVSVPSYRPEVIITDPLPHDVYADEVTVTLWLSPLLGGVNIGGPHLISIDRTSGKDWLKVVTARRDYSVATDRPQSADDTVQRVLDRLDSLMVSRCRPFKYSLGTHPMFVYSPLTLKDDIATLLTAPIDRSRLMLAPLRPPHVLTADTAFARAPVVVWSKVRASLFNGYSPLCYATAFEHQRWRARAMVSLDDGHSGVYWQGEGDDFAPVALGPLITYPLPGASAITIVVELDDGRVLSWHRRLSSSPDSSFSSCLDTSLRDSPGSTADETSLPDLPPPQSIDFSDYLVTASIDDPFSPVAIARIDAPAVAMTPALNTNRLSNFDTTRLYAMTPMGIYDVSVDSSGRRIRLNLLSTCPVSDPARVCVGPDASYVLANNYILAVSGGRASVVIPWIADARTIGWDDRHRCLTTAATDQYSLNFLPDMKMQYYQTDTVNPDVWLSELGHIITRDSAGNLILLSRGRPAGSTHIIWQATIPLPTDKKVTSRASDSPSSLRPVLTNTYSLPIDASVIDSTITIARDYLTSRRAPMTRLSIHGPVHHPIPIPIYSTRHPSIHLSIDAEASPDLRLSLPEA